jgi:glyoxylate/hydroxypyruvate reductase A
MALLFLSNSDKKHIWQQELTRLVPDLDFRVWPDAGNPEEIDFALIWSPPEGELAKYPNLKVACSLGAGVDHLMKPGVLPEGLPVVRLIDPKMSRQMREWIAYAVLRLHREMPIFEDQQRAKVWKSRPNRDTENTRVGILGIGELGALSAETLMALGFPVMGWSRSPKDIEGVECFHGPDGLTEMLRKTDILICLLPLTDETRGIINAEKLALLPEGASVINAARGAHIVDDDLIAALDSGHIAFAMMDVFHVEPLPEDHPYWSHPKVTVTPHVASLTPPETSAPQVAENIMRMRKGEPLLNQVDPKRGY